MSSNAVVATLNRGIAAYHEHQLAEARARFAEAVIADPDYELSWIWFATVTSDHHEQHYCIDRALHINPESPIRGRLDAVRHATPKVPPELAVVDLPTLPADLQPPAEPPPRLPGGIPIRRRLRPAPRQQATAADGEAPSLAQRLQFRWYQWVILALLPIITAGVIAVGLQQTRPVPYTIAIVAPLTGDEAAIGEEQVRAAQLAVDTINGRGGVNGNPIGLLVLDDGNDLDLAMQRAQQISQDDGVLFVIGHNDSAVTHAASAVYHEAGIPIINAAEATDVVAGTHNTDLFFSVVLPARNQGMFMGGYAHEALAYDTASIISTPDEYGRTIADAFDTTFTSKGGTITARWELDHTDQQASIGQVLQELESTSDSGLVVLALHPEEARDILIGASRAELDVTWFGAPSLGYDDFPLLFSNEPEEQATPGYFTNGLLAASPLIYDSIGGAAMEFSGRFQERFATSPGWFGAWVYDAVNAGATAIDRSNIDPTGDMAELRTAFTDALDTIGSAATAAVGLTSPLFFTPDGYVPHALSIGRFHDGYLRSEPIQYRLVADATQFLNLASDDAAGLVMTLEDGVFRQYQVVYTGIDIIEVSNLDTTNQTFTADFFIWMRYNDDLDATNITFANASDPTLSLGTPIQEETSNGETYQMFRVQGEFSHPLDFHDYPWDEHRLRIAFGNTLLSDNDLIYVADSSTLERTQAERLLSGADQSRPFNAVPSWNATSVWYSQEPHISRTATRDPITGVPGYASHSEFQIDMTYSRTIVSFLIKELVPLALLSLVLYITLFFPTEQTAARTGFAITSILTCSVLLQGISNRLPTIGYTVAIEYIFYVFIGMSAGIILLGIVMDYYKKAKRPGVVRRIERTSRLAYPLIIVAIACIYLFRFVLA